MPRRKNTKNIKTSKKSWTGFNISKSANVFGLSRKSETRFRISLVFLIAGLVFSLFILLLTIINVQNNQMAIRSLPVPAGSTASKSNFSINPVLENINLDFTLKIPSQLGEWLYKIGYAKSPIDETLSNQYVAIYVPQNGKPETNNFDDLVKDILTVRQFSQKEWKKLESGCKKGNQFYCETAGAKISEKNDKVFAYTKPGNCPKSIEARCRLADGIIESFKLK